MHQLAMTPLDRGSTEFNDVYSVETVIDGGRGTYQWPIHCLGQHVAVSRQRDLHVWPCR